MNAFWWWNRISVLSCTKISSIKLIYSRNANSDHLRLITLQTASWLAVKQLPYFNIWSNKRLNQSDTNCSYVIWMMSLVLGWFFYSKSSTLIPLIFIYVWLWSEIRILRYFFMLLIRFIWKFKLFIIWCAKPPSNLHWSESTVAVIFNGFKDMLSMPKMVKDDDDDRGSYIRNFIS